MDFIYTENFEKYNDILDRQIVDCICKHVMRLNSEKAKSVWEISNKLGYNQVMWGYTSNIWEDTELNRKVQLHTISKMIYKNFNRQFRIVIDKVGVPWIDNLHSALRDVIVYGDDIKLSQVSCYIVDMRTDPVTVVNINNTLSDSITDIRGCINSSIKRLNRVSQSLRDINYTICEFMIDNDINENALSIDSDKIDSYRKNILINSEVV